MPTSPTLPIQTAVYTLLAADATLTTTLGAGVYDEVPETASYPYVVVGEAYETPDNAHDRYGRRTSITLHVWSDHDGFSQAATIGSRVVELLDHTPLTVSGWAHIVTRFEFSQTLRDPDPNLRHMPIRFVVVTEETVA